MTPTRFRAILSALGWSGRGLARRLGYSETSIRQWDAGGSIPSAVAAWLERIVRPVEAHPLPDGWRIERRSRGRPKHDSAL